MEELQARMQAIQAFRNEIDAAQQSHSKPDFTDEQAPVEASVVDLPARDPSQQEQANKTSSPRRRNTTAKQKTGTTAKTTAKQTVKQAATKQKSVGRRQWRDVNSHPYVEELIYLETQAERLNQLLAERSLKVQNGFSTEGMNGRVNGAAIAQPIPAKQQSKAARKVVRDGTGETSSMPANHNQPEDLKAQADLVNRRIDQLLAELALMMREAEAIASHTPSNSGSDAVDRRGNLSKSAPPPVTPVPPAQHYSPSTLDQVTQEATETAQAMQYLSTPAQAEVADAEYAARRQYPRSKSMSSVKRFGLYLRHLLQLPLKPVDRIGDALLWVVVAAVARVGGRFLLATYPTLAPFVILLMLTPAAVAVYLACCVPRAGFVSIYRLFLIMVGLLVGGKL